MKRKRNQNKNKRDRKSSLIAEPDSTTSYYSSGRTIYHDDQLRSLLDLTTSNCRFCNKSIPHFSPEEFISHLKVCHENHNRKNGKTSHEDDLKLDNEIAHATLLANDTYNQLAQQSLLRRKHGALKNYLPCSSKYITSTNCEESLSTPTVNMRTKMKNPRKKCSAAAVRPEVSVIEERKHDNSQYCKNEDCPAPENENNNAGCPAPANENEDCPAPENENEDCQAPENENEDFLAPENENTEPACSVDSESTIEAVENETTTIIVDEIDDENPELDECPDPLSKGTLNEDSKGTEVCEEYKVKQKRRKSKSKRCRASWERNENHTSSSNSGLGKKREYMQPGPSWACKLSKFNNKSKSKKTKKKPKEKKSHNSSDSPFESNVDTSDDSSHPTRGRKAQKKASTEHPAPVPFSISVKVQENNIMQTVLAPGPSTSQNSNLGESSSKLTIVGKTKGSVKEYPEFRLTCAAATHQPSSPCTTSGDESSIKSLPKYKHNLPEDRPTIEEESVELHDIDTGAQLDGNTVAFEDVSKGCNTDKKEQENPEENTGNAYLEEIISENIEDILGIIDNLCKTTAENEVRNANPAIAENANAYNEVNGDNLQEMISPAPETVLKKDAEKSSSEHGQYSDYPTKNRRASLAERWQPELPVLMPQYFRSQSQARAAIVAEEEYRLPNNSRSSSSNALPTTTFPMAQSGVYSPSSPPISMRNVPQHIQMPIPVGQPPLIPHYDPYGTARPLNNHFPRNHFPPAMPGPHHYAYSGESHYQKTTTVHQIINVVTQQETLEIPMPQSHPAPSSQMHPYPSSEQQHFPWPHFTGDREQEMMASMQSAGRQQTFAEGRSNSYTGIIPPSIVPINRASCYNCNCFVPNEIPSPTTPLIRSPFTPTQVPLYSPPVREQQPLYNSLKRAIRPQEEFHSPTLFDSGRKRLNYHNFNVYK